MSEEASRSTTTGSRAAAGAPPRAALPRIRLKHGQLWLQLDRYPTAEEVLELARSVIPKGTYVRDWTVSPDTEGWSVWVNWSARERPSAGADRRRSS